MLFFFPALFFFSLGLKSSEWVGCKLFHKKKKQKISQDFWGKKKNKINTVKNGKTAYFTFFWPFFGDINFFVEWVACKLFPGKKKKLFSFPDGKKKNNKISQKRVSEWATNFSGKKKIRYLCSYMSFGVRSGVSIFLIFSGVKLQYFLLFQCHSFIYQNTYFPNILYCILVPM